MKVINANTNDVDGGWSFFRRKDLKDGCKIL